MSDIKFVIALNDYITNFINKAKKRVLIIKPAYFVSEVKLYLQIIKNKEIKCTLYLERGEQAIRFGYGDMAGLELIQKNSDKINVQTVEHIRLSIIIVDDEALVYTPIALYMEKEPEKITFPNGFYADNNLTAQILSQFNLDKNSENAPKDNIIPFPGCIISKVDEDLVEYEMEETIKKLKAKPPVDPLKLRKISFYRNNYKLLKIEVFGAHVNNKKISLKPFTSMLTSQDKRLINSWSIFTKEEADSINLLKLYESEVEAIKIKYTLEAGRFGYIISIQNKNKLEDDLKNLKNEFQEFITGQEKEDKKEVKNRFIEKKLENNISTKLDNSFKSLKKYILNKVSSDQEFFNKHVKKDKYIMNMYKDNTDEALKEFVNKFIYNSLKFPNEKDIVERVNVQLDYYDISDELLYENDEFKAYMDKYKDERYAPEGLTIRKYSDGFESE